MKVLQIGKVKQPKSILCIYVISKLNLFIKVFLSWHFPTLLYDNKIPLKILVLYLDRYRDDGKAAVWLYYIHCLPLILHSIFTTAYYKGFPLLQPLCFDGFYKKHFRRNVKFTVKSALTPGLIKKGMGTPIVQVSNMQVSNFHFSLCCLEIFILAKWESIYI